MIVRALYLIFENHRGAGRQSRKRGRERFKKRRGGDQGDAE